MFRLNIHAGLPEVVVGAENPLGISNRLTREGAHLVFPGAYGCGSLQMPHVGGAFVLAVAGRRLCLRPATAVRTCYNNFHMLQLTTILFLISFSTLAAIHYLALSLYLYWSVSWFDIPMHLFGGAVVALGIFTLRDIRLIPVSWLTLTRTIGFVFLVALLWEVFEFTTGMRLEANYEIDTIIDLCMGLLGGGLGFLVGKRMHHLR